MLVAVLLAASLQMAGTAAGPAMAAVAKVPACSPDGKGGARVQVVYAYISGRANNLPRDRGTIQRLALKADEVYEASARLTGGNRRIWFVHDAKCQVSVVPVALSTKARTDFNRASAELVAFFRKRGDSLVNRKYMVFADWSRNPATHCGDGTTFAGGGVAEANGNYGIGLTYRQCWNHPQSYPAHELMHNLGALPNDRRGHCGDERDLMCEGAGVESMPACTSTVLGPTRLLFDCSRDSYFHTDPPAGNPLAQHPSWNAAISRFLLDPTEPIPVVLTAIRPTAGGPDQVLRDVCYQPFRLDGVPAGEGQCDGADGRITFDLAPGTYVLRETDAPEGYETTDPAREKKVTVAPSQRSTAAAYNTFTQPYT